MRHGYTTILLALLFNVGNLYSQDVTSGAFFLELPHNVYQNALGEAANLEGLKALNTNPAGTTIQDNIQGQGLHTGLNFSNYPGGFLFTHLGILYWMGEKAGTIGLGVTYLHYGSIANIDASGNNIGNISAYDVYVGLNYSREIAWGLLIGTNIKVFQEKLDTFSATSFAVDIGLKKKFNVFKNGLWISVSGNHLGPSIKFDQVGTPLPSRLHISTNYVIKTWLPKWLQIKIGPQFNYFLEGYFNFTFAGEFVFDFDYFTFYTLASYRTLPDGSQVGVGGGGLYKAKYYSLDVSFGVRPQPFGTDLVTSVAFIHDLTQIKLSRVKPVDFTSDLKTQKENVKVESDEIIIKLDEPIQDVVDETPLSNLEQ